jgi:hypothetical protein
VAERRHARLRAGGHGAGLLRSAREREIAGLRSSPAVGPQTNQQ